MSEQERLDKISALSQALYLLCGHNLPFIQTIMFLSTHSSEWLEQNRIQIEKDYNEALEIIN